MGFIQLERWRVQSLGLMLGLLTGCGMIRITRPVGLQLVALHCGSGFRVKAWQGSSQALIESTNPLQKKASLSSLAQNDVWAKDRPSK